MVDHGPWPYVAAFCFLLPSIFNGSRIIKFSGFASKGQALKAREKQIHNIQG